LVEQTGADGVELNFGCPHGMPERGMGAAVGQVPEYIEMVTRWCKTHSRFPVIVKLTPNITDIRRPAEAARRGGADAVSLINTINSITSVNLDSMSPEPSVGGQGTHGGYCGPAVKPIALSMVSEIARNPDTAMLPISGIGGVSTWRDAAEFMSLGANNVQVCTAAMLYGFKIIDDLCDGLSDWMDDKGYQSLADFHRQAVPNTTDWKYLDMNYERVAEINQDNCIQCGRCFAACEDTSHQAVLMSENGDGRQFTIDEKECVGCNLCQITCPEPNAITMKDINNGKPFLNWTNHPANPFQENSN